MSQVDITLSLVLKRPSTCASAEPGSMGTHTWVSLPPICDRPSLPTGFNGGLWKLCQAKCV